MIRPPETLRVTGLHAWLGESHVLQGIDFVAREGEIVTLLGRPGSGCTATLKAIVGLVGRNEGAIRWQGQNLLGLSPRAIAGLGIGYCPQARSILAGLSTEENLLIPREVRAGGMALPALYELFPSLHERRHEPGANLTEGERQVLGVARLLRAGARVLLLDEITSALAPPLARRLGQVIRLLRLRGFTFVLAEQDLRFAGPLADRHYVLERGRVATVVERAELGQRTAQLRQLLGA